MLKYLKVLFSCCILLAVTNGRDAPTKDEIIAKLRTLYNAYKDSDMEIPKGGLFGSGYHHPISSGKKDPDVGKNMVEIVAEKGYPIEEHYVTTEDKYILGVFRIPYGRNETENTSKDIGKPVVFLQHGLLDSSYTWVNNFQNQSLGFILADAGYDVWLGNNRGNRFSQQHETYKTDSKEFWAFSWDEMARYDAPDMIEYVLNYTNQTQLAYVGHSEGTTQMFGMPSTMRKDVQDKIAVFGALAGVAYVHHCKSIIFDLMAYLDLEALFELLGIKQFLPGKVVNALAPDFCDGEAEMGLCDFFLELLVGPSTDINETRIQVYVSETPADTSVQNMAHWGQMITHEEFRKYNYGDKEENEKHYGTKDPPYYYLANVTVPTALYSGTNDYLADPDDVKTLVKQLPNSTLIEHVVIDGFAHLDFGM